MGLPLPESKTTAKLDVQAEKKERLDKLDERIIVKTKAAATVAEIEAMGKTAVFGVLTLRLTKLAS